MSCLGKPSRSDDPAAKSTPLTLAIAFTPLSQEMFRSDRQLTDSFANCVKNRIGNRRRRSTNTDFADAASADRIEFETRWVKKPHPIGRKSGVVGTKYS